MAKFDLKDFDKLVQTKLQTVLDEITSTENLQALGEQLKNEIFTRTKLGYGVESKGAPQSKLKPLTPAYKKARKGHLSNKLSADTSPARSNLTLTGDMLNDMKVTTSNNKVTVGFGSNLSEKKVEWNTLNGRSFFNVSKAQILALTRSIKAKLQEILKKV